MAKKVIVVRVGTKTTHIVHMDNVKNNPTIYGCIRVPTPEDVVDNGTIRDVVELGRRIKSACRDKSIHTTDVIFSVISSKIASRDTTIPAVAASKVEQLVMAKVPDLFPVDPNNYIFSYTLQGKEYTVQDSTEPEEPEEEEENEDDKKKKGKKKKKSAKNKNVSKVQDVNVFAAPEELVQSYYALANAAGLNIIAVDADGNAMFQMMRRQVMRGEVCMSIQISEAGTLVNVVDSNKLYLQRTIPYGVNVFTDIMLEDEAFGVSDYDEAFQLLSTQRVLLPTLNATNPSDDESMEKRIQVTNGGDFLIQNISRVVEYYNSHYRDKPISKIICTGQGCSVAGLNALISSELGIVVETPQTLDGIHFNRKVTVDAALLRYINCFGAVFEPVKFVPKEIATREANRGGLAAATGVFIVGAGISALLIVISVVRLLVATSANDTAHTKYSALAPVQGEYDNLKQIQTNYAVTQSLELLLSTNNNYFPVLIEDLTDIVPAKFRIQSIQSNEEGVTISVVTADKLSSLSALLIQLKSMEGIKDAEISGGIAQSDNNETGGKQYQYTLTFVYDNEERDQAVQNILSNNLTDTVEVQEQLGTSENEEVQ